MTESNMNTGRDSIQPDWTDRRQRMELADALRKVVWGYVLIHIAINLGTLDVLPDWAGFWLMVTVLPILAKYTPSALLLRPLGLALLGWSLVLWVLNFLGGMELPQIITVLFAIIDIYFHFQLLTNVAEIAEMTACGNPDSIRKLRTWNTILTSIFYLPLPWNRYQLVTIGLLILIVVLTIGIMVVLNQMKSQIESAS